MEEESLYGCANQKITGTKKEEQNTFALIGLPLDVPFESAHFGHSTATHQVQVETE